MPIFTKESLETLRQRIDLIEVMSPYVQFTRSGSSYKTLCPFHPEKTPSFIVQKGDHHYHCFGCGAHGDAIQFLMTYLKMGFGDAVEYLADKFQVRLEIVDQEDKTTVNKRLFKRSYRKSRIFLSFLSSSHRGRKKCLGVPFSKRHRFGFY